MSNFETKENQGSLFANKDKTKDTQPDYTGKLMVGGKLMRLSAWKQTSQSGTNYLSIRLSEFEQKPATSEAKPATSEYTIVGTSEKDPFDLF